MGGVTIVDSSASGNGGGVSATGTDVFLRNVLLSSNHAGGDGGGLSSDGGAVNLTNATVYANSADGYGGGVDISSGSLYSLFSTVVGNHADADGTSASAYGGGIAQHSSTLTLINSAFAENTSGGPASAAASVSASSAAAANAPDVPAFDDVLGLVDSATNCDFATTPDITAASECNFNNSDAGLVPLADNGGQTETLNLLPCSSLIGAGDDSFVSSLLGTETDGNGQYHPHPPSIGATDTGNLIVVTTLDDVTDLYDNKTSLREAIDKVNLHPNDGYTIAFDCHLAGGTLKLTQGELALHGDAMIDGDVDGDGEADITIDGNRASRILHVTGNDTDVKLHSLTLINGNTVNPGGAVFVDNAGTFRLESSSIFDSTASAGGGIAIIDSGDASIKMSIIGGNSGYTSGGLDISGGSLALTATTVYGNMGSGSYAAGGINVSNGSLTLINSGVTGNFCYAASGAIVGGVNVNNSVFVVIGSAVAGNELSGPNDDYASDVEGNVSTATGSFFGTPVTITNSGNSSNGAGGALIGQSGAMAAGYTDSNGNIINGGDPMLGELLDNGGPVLTRSPLDGSPLINAGKNALLPRDVNDVDHDGNTIEAMPLDARGGLRIVGGKVDIGAVEHIANENIGGTDEANHIIGGLGKDTMSGLGGADTIDGGAGNDIGERRGRQRQPHRRRRQRSACGRYRQGHHQRRRRQRSAERQWRARPHHRQWRRRPRQWRQRQRCPQRRRRQRRPQRQ